MRFVTRLAVATLGLLVVFFLQDHLWWTVPLLIFAAGTVLAVMQGCRLTVTGGLLGAAFALVFSVVFWLL